MATQIITPIIQGLLRLYLLKFQNSKDFRVLKMHNSTPHTTVYWIIIAIVTLSLTSKITKWHVGCTYTLPLNAIGLI